MANLQELNHPEWHCVPDVNEAITVLKDAADAAYGVWSMPYELNFADEFQKWLLSRRILHDREHRVVKSAQGPPFGMVDFTLPVGDNFRNRIVVEIKQGAQWKPDCRAKAEAMRQCTRYADSMVHQGMVAMLCVVINFPSNEWSPMHPQFFVAPPVAFVAPAPLLWQELQTPLTDDMLDQLGVQTVDPQTGHNERRAIWDAWFA